MSITSYFYDSVANDRIYSAVDFADAFSIVMRTGVIPDGTGDLGFDIGGTNYTTIFDGKAVVNGRFIEVEGTETLIVPPGSYDGMVVIRVDIANARIATLAVRDDRTPQQDASIWELPLYNVVVADGIMTGATDLRVPGGAGEGATVNLNTHINDYVKHPGVGTTTNITNNYFVSLNPAPTSYVDKMGIVLQINANSTAAATINVNGLGTKALKTAAGDDVTNLKANGIYSFRYNGTTGNFILLGEGGISGTTLTNFIADSNSILGM
jgi:hypothetical protein